DEIIMLEVKHHLNHHVYTGLAVVLEVNSTLEDLKEGFKLGKNTINFSRALIVCNTKFSDHAIRYAKCKGIELIGWKYPEEKGLESLIEEKKLYPITFLRDLDEKVREKFSVAGIFLLKQLLDLSLEEIHEKTGISRSKLRKLVENAKEIISSK
ncbi:MAG: restriction endonuclease, partial [Nitrososphaeria archaeon]